MRRTNVSLLLAVALLLSACGGGGGGGGGSDLPVYDLIAQNVASTPSRSGTVYEHGTVILGAEEVVVGDLGSDTGIRAFQSFPLGALPPADRIHSVTYVDGLRGTSGEPHASLGNLLLRTTDIGPTLDAGDYGGPPVSAVLGILSSSPGFDVERTVDLTDWVRSMVESGADRIDFMIAFADETDGDGRADMQWLRSTRSAVGPSYLRVMVRTTP